MTLMCSYDIIVLREVDMSKKVQYCSLAIIVAIVLVLITNIIHSCTQRKKVELEQQIEFLADDFTPMSFEVSKSKDSEIKLKTVFYNLDGKKISSESIKLSGQELNFDFQVVKLSDKSYLFFPCGIYTDQVSIVDATKVFDYYNKDGFPEIYKGIDKLKNDDGKRPDYASRSKIIDTVKLYFSMATGNQSDFATDTTSVAVHDMKNVNQLQKGDVYKVVCNPHSGDIRIIKE